MNINLFFSLLFFSLAMIFVLFKPLNLKEQSFVNVPLFELKFFTLFELNSLGLTTFMTGDSSTKYDDRQLVTKINYTDNSQKYIANMKASNGVYKEKEVLLSGDIVYIRKDGLTFQTDKAVYSKEKKTIETESKFSAFRANNSVQGSSLKYYNDSQKIHARDVVMKYQLKESL